MEIEVPGGDFEFSPFPSSGGWINYNAGEFMGPWQVSNGSVSHHDDGHNNLGAGNPNSSSAHCDLNGSDEGGICQDISGFVIGVEYTLIFWYAIHNAAGTGEAIVEIDGGAALSESWSASNQGQNLWLEASYTFIATSTNTDLCFYSDGGIPCCGMLIDDIQITFSCTGDMEFPVLLSMPSDESYQCLDDVPEPEDVDAEDNCATNLDVELDENFSSPDPCDVIITRRWFTEDECNNLTEHTQVITVEDTEAPEIVQPMFDLIIGCDQDVADIFFDWIDNYGGAQLVDACGGDVYIDANYTPFDFNQCSETEVTFTFSDICGNEIVDVAYFSVVDMDAPVFDVLPQNLDIPCGADVQSIGANWLNQNGFSEVSDLCGFSMTNDFNGSFGSSQIVTFSATDLCGSVSSASAELIINSDLVVIEIDAFTCDPNQAGVEELLLDNVLCDSLIITNYTLLPSSTLNIDVNTCNIFDAGIDTLFFTNTFNCDSLVIVNTLYTPPDTIYSNNTTCNAALVGLDTLLLLSLNNCDSLVVVNTSYVAADTTYNTLMTCDASQVSLDTLLTLNVNNCDSLIIINTIYVEGDTTYNTTMTCDASQVGLDTIFMLNANDCDSLVITNAVYEIPDTLFNSIATCELSEIGSDTLFLNTANNCDSVVVNSFYLVQNDTIVMTSFSCFIDQPQYSDSLAVGPVCDTIIIVELLPLDGDLIEIEMTTCKLSEVGVFSENHFNTAGCDSMVVTTVNYVPIDTIFYSTETCFVSELTQDTINVFSEDCDSVFVYSTILLVGNEIFSQEVTCDVEEAGVDTLVLENQMGCDSLILTEYLFDPIIFDVYLEYDSCGVEPVGVIAAVNTDGGELPYSSSLDGINFFPGTLFFEVPVGEYSMYLQDANGCISDPYPVVIEENILLEVALPSLVLLTQGGTQQIEIEFSEDPASFYWSDESLVSCNDCLNPFIASDQDAELILYYEGVNGCIYSRLINIEVTELPKIPTQIYIPNVFSPDGVTGNEEFTIFNTPVGMELEACEIFDRWGNRVYQNLSNRVEDLKWNGISNGEKVMSGVYVYRIILETENGERIELFGDVTLLW